MVEAGEVPDVEHDQNADVGAHPWGGFMILAAAVAHLGGVDRPGGALLAYGRTRKVGAYIERACRSLGSHDHFFEGRACLAEQYPRRPQRFQVPFRELNQSLRVASRAHGRDVF